MDNSPAYENFNNKMTSMRGGVGGSPILKRRKIDANKVFNKIGWLIWKLSLLKYSCKDVIHDNIT